MTEYLVIACLVLSCFVIGLQIAIFRRRVSVDQRPFEALLNSTNQLAERMDRTIREEVAQIRAEQSRSELLSRQEMANLTKNSGDSLLKQLTAMIQYVDKRLATMRETIEQRLGSIQDEGAKKLDLVRAESIAGGQKSRDEVTTALNKFDESQRKTINDLLNWQRSQFEAIVNQQRLVAEQNEKRLAEMRTTMEQRLKSLQDDNAKSLDQMRATVDEKLQGTLEKRLGESFKLVSERLEQVYKGLGEMQNLAAGVGDLKRVLTNVKARGTWGEVQLDRMLEQILTPEQYERNCAVKDNSERVEFAIRLPGRSEDSTEVVYLPIDAKFPIEDYQRLQEAQEQGDSDLVEAVGKQLEARVKGCACDIAEKYISPPKTTDFAILFLPTEGLFAEVVRRNGLTEALQQNYRVIVAGPTTLWAVLNSLQMGFRTLAIQKRSSDVWNLLAAVKTEFSKYGEVLGKVQKKLQEATNTIDSAAVRTRAIERKLRNVQELPTPLATITVDIEDDLFQDQEIAQ